MRSKADETLVIVETLICPLQISHLIAIMFLTNIEVKIGYIGYLVISNCKTRLASQSARKFILLQTQQTK